MGGPFGLGFQSGLDHFFDLFVSNFPWRARTGFVFQNSNPAPLDEPVAPKPHGKSRGVNGSSDGLVTQALGALEEDPSSKHQVAVLPLLENLLQLLLLLLRDDELQFLGPSSAGGRCHGL